MYEGHPLSSTCRPLYHHYYHDRGRCADHLWLRVGWCWTGQVQKRAWSGLRPLCGYEGQENGEEIRYGPTRMAKGFLEATDIVEGGF